VTTSRLALLPPALAALLLVGCSSTGSPSQPRMAGATPPEQVTMPAPADPEPTAAEAGVLADDDELSAGSRPEGVGGPGEESVIVHRSYLDELEGRVSQLESWFDEGERPTAEALSAYAAAEDEAAMGAGEDDSTGTDPRAFGTKFMPYYRTTELRNGLKTKDLVLFGLARFDDQLAATYEISVAKNMDYGGLAEFGGGMGIPPNPGEGAPAGGLPFTDLDPDGDESGLGDSIFRLMYKNPESMSFDSPFKEGGAGEVMLMLETTVPTASEPILGGETLVASPGFAVVADMPGEGSFIAMMNFFDIDVWKDNSRDDLRRFRGRWFYMKPLTPPAFLHEQNPEIPDLGLLSGLYLLPEVQPVYDFETDDFSLWIAPEIGKVISEGKIVYLKPGWGVSPDRYDRDFTFEMGWRYFF
jgi:hypothetical protein